uniref:Uncharacterized protein MANES_16G100600 n=1 Tax=Rhizophora mucronata TaxID=61149 RepID=A0A2P2MLX4_RHIMU
MGAIIIHTNAHILRQRPHFPTVHITQNRHKRLKPHIIVLSQVFQLQLGATFFPRKHILEEGTSGGKNTPVDRDLKVAAGDYDFGVGEEIEIVGFEYELEVL